MHLVTVVRAQTLAALEGLDPYRKRILLQFLFESGLIQKDKTVVSLAAANLGGADLSGADLNGADLSGATLSGANLSKANLSRANLSRVRLNKANLSEAILSGSKGINNEQLKQQAASLEGATMPDGSKHP